jgi:uncharacterized membrane protein
MDQPGSASPLEQRVRELEQRVAELEAAAVPKAEAHPPTNVRSGRPRAAAPAHFRVPWNAVGESSEGWLARVGVGLLVVGLILLFRYAADRGWLTPALRIAVGLALGAVMLVWGVFFLRERRLYRQIVAGGGITILFITGLAASELYHLVSIPAALVFFAAVASVAFVIAARQEESIIATVGSVGALLPPAFLLEDTTRGVLLWLYMALITAGSGLLFFRRNWHLALAFGAIISVAALFHPVSSHPGVQVAAIAACVVCWVSYAAMPLLARRFPAWLLIALPTTVTIALAGVMEAFIIRDAYGFEAAAGLGALVLAGLAVSLRDDAAAYNAAVFACVAALAAASIAAFEHPWLYVAIGVIAAIAMQIHDKIRAPALHPLAHLMYAGVATAFIAVLAIAAERPAFDEHAIAVAITTAIGAVTALRLQQRAEKVTYFVVIYILVHVLLASELSDVRGARWLASASYGAVGSALLLIGLGNRDVVLQRAGMISLALLVLRLFMYDMSNVDVAIRIILFIVFGLAFLALSYMVRSPRFADEDHHAKG